MATHQNRFAGTLQDHVPIDPTLHERIAERRKAERTIPELLTYVSFSGHLDSEALAENGGMVLDVSETGMALVAALAITDGATVQVSIPADATHPLISVSGQVVWIAESKRRLGMKFDQASPKDRELVRRWIQTMSGREPASTPVAVKEGIPTASTANVATAAKEMRTGGISPATPALAEAPRAATPAELPRPRVEAKVAETRLPLGPPAAERAEPALPQRGPQPPRTSSLRSDISEKNGVSAKSRVSEKDGVSEKTLVSGKTMASENAEQVDLWPRLAQEQTRATAAERAPVTANAKPEIDRTWFVAVALLIVAASFAAGIFIGRSVWRQRATNAPVASAKSSPAKVTADVAPGNEPNQAPTAAAQANHPSASDPGAPAASPQVNDEAIPKSSAAEVADTTAASSPAATDDLMVTPNLGDTPLRIDFAEQVVLQSPSLEIRARRFVMVPGEPGRRGKARKERLKMGGMISKVTPQPPQSALSGSEQTVVVRASVADDGHVNFVDPVSGPIGLTPSVMSAVRQWRYQPSTLNGEPLETDVDLTITFRPAH